MPDPIAFDLEHYPAVRANPDKAARLEDSMMMILAAMRAREAELQLCAWALGEMLTDEQYTFMRGSIEDRKRDGRP